MKEKLNLSVEEAIKEKAKVLSAKTKMTVSEIFELLILGKTIEEIHEIAKKRKIEKKTK